MSTRLNLKPRFVYFLKQIDDSNGIVFPYVKVGVTDRPIQVRIDQLQTGTPFRIVAHDHFASEAAEIVERHIHRSQSDRRVRLEWLHVNERELSDIVANARQFNQEVSAKARQVREYDQTLQQW